MTIYIVLKDDHVNAAFLTEEAAAHHVKQLQRRWSIMKIIPIELQEI